MIFKLSKYDQVETLADRFVALYVNGKLDRLDVAYTRFTSISKQTAVLETLLPIGELDVLGAWRAGLIPCPLPLLWRLDEIHRALPQIKPKAAVSVSHYAGEPRAQTLGEAATRHMNIRNVFAFGDDLPDGITPINDWLCVPQMNETHASPGTGATPDISNNTAIITWTVCEQGPYPVARTHGELMALARMVAVQLKLNGSDVVLNTYPFTGIAALAGQLVAPLLAGCEVVQHLPFNFEVFLQQLKRHDVTYTAVPAPVIAELEKRHNLRSGDLHLTRLGCVWPNPHAIPAGPELCETPVPIFHTYIFSELAMMMRDPHARSDLR